MNERIRELMIQSNPHGDFKDCEWVFEKFAELIVREYSYDCMDVTSSPEHIQFVARKWGVEL